MKEQDTHTKNGNSKRATNIVGARLRPTLAEAKPPRQWRTTRHALAQQHAVAPPRVERQLASEPASPPAGSRIPVDETPAVAVPAATDVGGASSGARSELPQRYGVDRLLLLVRDPHWVYAWWEVTETNLEAGRSQLAGADLVLRVYDVSAIHWDGSNHHTFFDIAVQDSAGNWYIELGKPGSSFCAELGLRSPDGRFLALVRSNFVTLPRDGVSDVLDEEWMIVEEDFNRLFELAGGHSIGLGSGEILRMLEQRLRSEWASGGVSSFSSPQGWGKQRS